MNMLVEYDRATSALSAALRSKDVHVVLKSREELDHIKLRARQIRDRTLLADATEFQMRIERHLGNLLRTARDNGHLREGRPLKVLDGKLPPASLKDIGVDKKLSMKAQRAAALNQHAFDEVICDMRSRLKGSKAKLVSTIGDAEKRMRRSPSAKRDCYGFQLVDGTKLGHVKLGKIRSRIEQLAIEMKILQAVNNHVGSASDELASIEDSISEVALEQIINEAKGH